MRQHLHGEWIENTCPDYKHNFDEVDFQQLADVLKCLQGKFMLSINDHPEIRTIFTEFNCQEVSLLYTVSKAGPTEANELIYSNYKMKEKTSQSLFSDFL